MHALSQSARDKGERQRRSVIDEAAALIVARMPDDYARLAGLLDRCGLAHRSIACANEGVGVTNPFTECRLPSLRRCRLPLDGQHLSISYLLGCHLGRDTVAHSARPRVALAGRQVQPHVSLVSIGPEKGPRIGAEKGPPCGTGVADPIRSGGAGQGCGGGLDRRELRVRRGF